MCGGGVRGAGVGVSSFIRRGTNGGWGAKIQRTVVREKKGVKKKKAEVVGECVKLKNIHNLGGRKGKHRRSRTKRKKGVEGGNTTKGVFWESLIPFIMGKQRECSQDPEKRK